MSYMSSEQQKEFFEKVFGADLGAKYYVLKNHVTHAHMNWAMRSELMKNQERRLLLDSTGRHFFIEVHRLFVNDVILRLSRLTDPAQHGKQENLSLYALLDDISCPTLKSEIEDLIEKAKDIIAPLKKHRHKRIAHFDLQVALQSPDVSLPPFTEQTIDEGLAAVADVLKQLWAGYPVIPRETLWVPVEIIPGIERFLRYLESGLSQEQARRDEALAGINQQPTQD